MSGQTTTSIQDSIDIVQRLRGERIQWKKEDKTFADLETQIKQGRFNLNPEHQRHVVHNDKWKSEVLHSQIYHGDIPDVYFHPTMLPNGTRKYDSLDGKQRCSAINDYLSDAFAYKIREPECMYNKKFSELTPAFQSFLKDDCSITARMANRTLTPHEIQSFFQKRQNFKKTSGGEHLNSCITSSIHEKVKKYIEDPAKNELLKNAGFLKNDRHQYTESISYILRTFNHHNDNNIDCSPTKLKQWYSSEEPLGGPHSLEQAFELVNHTLGVLQFINVSGGNSRKNVYVSCAWYIMNFCFGEGGFDKEKIDALKIEKNIILPKVGGDHNGKEQREAFKKFIEE